MEAAAAAGEARDGGVLAALWPAAEGGGVLLCAKAGPVAGASRRGRRGEAVGGEGAGAGGVASRRCSSRPEGEASGGAVGVKEVIVGNDPAGLAALVEGKQRLPCVRDMRAGYLGFALVGLLAC